MLQRVLLLASALATVDSAADLSVREVILYKHGVAFFERAGELKSGEPARLDFKAEEMNDVLKSLTISDRSGGKVSGVRYDASEPLDKRLADFPFAVGQQPSLASFLDQMKGARIEIKVGSDTINGTIVGARVVRLTEKDQPVERESLVLLTDAGDIRALDLGSATSVRLSDPKLQGLLRDYLTVLNGSRSKDRRSVYIDAANEGARQLVASYVTPAAIWKSSYRLIFGASGDPTLEGWAIVDNMSGEDWDKIKLSVVSGRPISFISKLYEPRYVQRPTAELAENNSVAPVVLQGDISGGIGGVPPAAFALRVPPPAPAARPKASAQSVATPEFSSVSSVASGQDLGELFEYSFPGPVTVKKGESAMLPFIQQRLNARKLLIFTDNMNLHPMNAAEISNTTGKTLDGGPITVYDNGAYGGEALVETLKAGDKRLISYGVDLGTRISTAWDSSRDIVREIHLRRGTLTTRSAVQETKAYTIRNVDAQPKTLIIEHTERPGYDLINRTPSEKTANSYRFEVKVAASGTETFPLQEERVFDQSVAVSSATPDTVASWLQNKTLSDSGRMQLEQIAAKKREIAENDTALEQVDQDQRGLSEDQDRLRKNLQSLNSVPGQQDQVQQYARQLAASEARLATLRDNRSQLQRKKAALQGELNGLIEKADF
jgi:hypothetical protein